MFWSKSKVAYLDGLEFSSLIERDFDPSKASEKLNQLLNAAIYNFRPTSSMAPELTAAYFLGASPQKLTALFEKWSAACEVWPEDDAVAESIGKDTLDEFYGQAEMDHRFYDYFRDCNTEERTWNKVVKKHTPLFWRRLANDNLRPLIELAASLEADNGMIAASALTLACILPETDVHIGTDELSMEGEQMAKVFRHLAKKALASKNSTGIQMVQACAEVFLSPKARLMENQHEVPILAAVETFLNNAAPDDLPDVTPEEALASEDGRLITYTRSRMVLDKFAR